MGTTTGFWHIALYRFLYQHYYYSRALLDMRARSNYKKDPTQECLELVSKRA